MAMHTLAQAAHMVGKNRATLLRAIKNGRLSASRDTTGAWLVDTSELMRVYSAQAQPCATHKENAQDAQGAQAEVAVLQARLDALQQQVEMLKDERNDLRRRLDDESAERRKLTAMVAHQPTTTPEPTAAPQLPAEPTQTGVEDTQEIGLMRAWLKRIW